EEDEEVQKARKYQDFQTEVSKLIPVWHTKPINVRREFVNLFVKRAILEIVSPHWVRLTIEWYHPAWETDVLLIYRRNGSQPDWTEPELDILRDLYSTAPRDEILARLPLRTWSCIMKEARKLQVARHVATPCQLPVNITWLD